MEWWAIWLIACGVLLVAELLTLTFYLLWLSIGAGIAAIAALIFPDAYLIQALAGGAGALLLTIYTKPLTKRLRATLGYRDAHEEIVGRYGIVVEKVSPDRPGIVKVGGDAWSAKSEESLEPGESVEIVGKSTAMLTVRRRGGNSG